MTSSKIVRAHHGLITSPAMESSLIAAKVLVVILGILAVIADRHDVFKAQHGANVPHLFYGFNEGWSTGVTAVSAVMLMLIGTSTTSHLFAWGIAKGLIFLNATLMTWKYMEPGKTKSVLLALFALFTVMTFLGSALIGVSVMSKMYATPFVLLVLYWGFHVLPIIANEMEQQYSE